MSETTTRPQRRWPLGILAGLVLVAAIGGWSLGRYLRFELPDVNKLEDYSPPVITRVLAGDGALVDTFFEQRRMMLEFGDLPEVFKHALIAVEDANFYDHTGVDVAGVARAVWRNVTAMRRAQGASTLTQQLARNLFLTREKTFRRKFQEMLLAIEIERRYSKDEILRFYCNQVYMGHGRYGLEAAARYYLDKPARELTLDEAALLAGLIQRPEDISPFKNPQRAQRRRDHVLARMVAEGFLAPDQAEAARQAPIPNVPGAGERDTAPYFVEQVRRWLKQEYGDSSLYRAGLEVRTTLDPRLQAYANEAVEQGLRELDRRQGWRGVQQRVPPEADLLTWDAESWRTAPRAGEVVDGVVLTAERGRYEVRVAQLRGRLEPEDLAWTSQGGKPASFEPGDLLRVRLTSVHDDGTAELALEQEPLVEAALVALDPATGAVRALVGGFDFERSEFDRAVQARRQTGSAFKPFVFAAALAEGLTLADSLVDEPTVFLDPRQPVPYLPKNYTNQYYGAVTLRRALEKSANVATVRLLDKVGTNAVIETSRRLGISSGLRPYASLALGSFEISLLELTSAFGTFANNGVRVEPHLVEEVLDRSGSTLFRKEPEIRDAVGPQIAYLMTRVMEGVITDGTGRAAASLGRALAGKTGTTDDYTDAWFVGYAPDLAVGVWVGFDEKKSLGKRETGAGAALPIWTGFMRRALEHLPDREFERPERISVVVIDRQTGLRANPAASCSEPFSEVFVSGTEPTAYCSRAAHARLRLPYLFHGYPLTEQGELEIPERELLDLLENEPQVYLADGGARLEFPAPEGLVSLPLQVTPGGGGPPLSESMLAALAEQEEDPTRWVGTDGRQAAVVLFRN